MNQVYYPVTIIKDRYSGTYSGGNYVAFPLDPWDVPKESQGGDVECMEFWADPSVTVGKGRTEKEANDDLKSKMGFGADCDALSEGVK